MKKIITVILIISLMAILFTGCGAENDKYTIVSTDGSTSMEKVMGYLSEAYSDKNEDVKITYNPTGSGSGIKAVKEGRCDIGLSSRDLENDEKQSLKETIIAVDGIAIIINSKNKVRDLSIEQISSLFCGEVTNWNELGGNNSPIVLIGREAASGTRDGFESVIKATNKCKYSQELTSSGDVAQAVASNPNAIGYVSLAAINESINIISIDSVYPSKETIQNGSYKIRRDFLFITKENDKLSKCAQEFFNYVTSGMADDFIEKAGFIPIVR